MPEAILFDFDGVLADSEPLHHACWKHVLAAHGVDLTWDIYERHCVGIADREMIAFLCGLQDPPLPADRLFAEYPRKKRLFAERVRDRSPIPERTRELLRSLEDYRLAVVSSSGRAEIEPMLESAGVRPLFQAVICGDDVKRLKPAPDPYLLAARRLGISTALVVEDSEPGVASGRAAGFEVLRISGAQAMPDELRAHLSSIRLPATF